MGEVASGTLHHVELWVPDLARAVASWGWLLTALGYEQYQDWPDGRSWRLGATYVVVEQSPALSGSEHDRRRPGLNHLAFHAGTRGRVDELAGVALKQGWTLLFPDRHPHAGGPEHYAAYLHDQDGYEVELVAGPLPGVPQVCEVLSMTGRNLSGRCEARSRASRRRRALSTAPAGT